MINWRALLDHLRVPWRDRGSNVSRGHIVLACPWCGSADPSMHLSIEEESGGYRCHRNPSQHKGRSPFYLLLALGAPTGDALDSLLRSYGYTESDSRSRKPEDRPKQPERLEAVARIWSQLDRVDATLPSLLAYLKARGFEDPAAVASRFGLRGAFCGHRAQRVFFPCWWEDTLTGFTGRAIHDTMEPRYLAEDPEGGSLYLPIRPTTEPVFLPVEGPMDALKLAAYGPDWLLPAAIVGTDALSPTRLLRLCTLAAGRRTVLVLDEDQPSHIVYNVIRTMNTFPRVKAERGRIVGSKDFGAMSRGEIQQWVRQNLTQSPNHQNGETRMRDGHETMPAETGGA